LSGGEADLAGVASPEVAQAAVLKAGKPRTPDLGGKATTTAVADAVLAAL